MANASRRSKKQPEYDPNELADLIAVPAVGSGVGSHLLSRSENADPATLSPPQTPVTTGVSDVAPTVVSTESPPVVSTETSCFEISYNDVMPTVDMSAQATVVATLPTPVATMQREAWPDDVAKTQTTTVVITEAPTVAESGPSRTAIEPTGDTASTPVVDTAATPVVMARSSTGVISRKSRAETFGAGNPQAPTGVSSGLSPVVTPDAITPELPLLWISESGEVVVDSRVRALRAAQDGLSSGEAAVYDVLWRSARALNLAGARSVQAGYHDLTQKTGLSRKTIQRTIDRLIAKQYIEIETQADIYQRTATVYRVYAADVILKRLLRAGRTHVAKIGAGVAFVSRLNVSAGQGTVLP